MPFTPLHAVLGEPSGDLTFGLIERACSEAVPERSDLDWKRQLPLTATKADTAAKQHQQLELAKDIAAMANSGGGMIVYGVAETTAAGTSAAETVVPVGRVDEATTRDIRRVAGNLVYPPVTGLELLPTAPTGEPDAGVLVMLVPDSLDRPHLVHPTNGTDWFGVPYRHGPDTEWMVERQIAAAYAERESGRRRRHEEFDDRFADFLATLPQDIPSRNWVVAFAVPDQPFTRPRDLTLSSANAIIEQAWAFPLQLGTGPRDMTAPEQTRRGLQRFSRTAFRQIQVPPVNHPARMHARIEVHGDGTVAVAFTRDGAIVGEGRQPGHVPINDIDSSAVDFLALLLATRTALGLNSDYTARLTVHPPAEVFRRRDPVVSSAFIPTDGHRVFGYRPVDGVIVGAAGRDELMSSWVDIVTDAVHQAGASTSLSADNIATTIWLEE